MPAQSASYWQRDTSVTAREALREDAKVDVCVVGAGIAGLTTAYCLLQQGKSVLVLDDGPIAGGETGRTTAHLVTALDDRYFWLEKVHGEERAALAAESHSEAIDWIEKVVAKEAIDCDFERIDGYLFLPPRDPIDILERELAAAHRVGLTDVELRQYLQLGSFEAGPSLRFPRQGQFHILRYMQGLAEAIEKQGGRICTQTHVSSVEGGTVCHTETANGHRVTSKATVLATNAPIRDNVSIYGRQAAYRTYVIACAIPKGSVPKALYWDTLEASHPERPSPYHYIRIEEGKGSRDTLIIGGEDHKTGQADDAGIRFSRLERWAEQRFPMIEQTIARWSGQVMETADGLAFIGKNPAAEENVYIISGDSGNGMTHCTIGGILLTDLICGKENPWAELYDPSRVRLHATGVAAREAMNTAKEMVTGWLGSSEVASPDDIKINSGAIMRRGVKKIALYRDTEGTMHAFSAVCPHRGCIVEWNSFEKSWDCPCHGSRFDAQGHVVNGPSIADLSPDAAGDQTESSIKAPPSEKMKQPTK